MPTRTHNRKRAAGDKAEQQMAFYLNRAFRDDPRIRIINNLRLVDPNQPEHNGRPGVCQIDHLVLHQHGAFIVESKSVGDEITVTPDGNGGDEWTYKWNGAPKGVASPIEQAKRQRDFLRTILHAERERLLAKIGVGLRTLAKIVAGTDQRGFTSMPIQLIVAVSDNGKINRRKGWKEPTKPFKTFLCKADQAPRHITEELKNHASWLGKSDETKDYGLWSMKPEELDAVHAFLRDRNTPASASAAGQATVTTAVPNPPIDLPGPQLAHAPKQTPASGTLEAACKACGSTSLTAKSGRFGYYWACNDCSTNTAMPLICAACGENGKATKRVRIRKDRTTYLRTCESCGIDQVVWRAPAGAAP